MMSDQTPKETNPQPPVEPPGPVLPPEAANSPTLSAIEQEIESVKDRIAASDQALTSKTGAAREAALEDRDALIERLHQLADQLPSPSFDDPDPGPSGAADEPDTAYTHDGRRNIVLTPLVYRMLDETVEAFGVANQPPTFYQRAGRLARFTPDPLTGEAVLTEIGQASFTAELSRMVNFCKRVEAEERTRLVPMTPPAVVVQALMESPPRSAPAIRRIRYCPYLRASGYVVREQGYQPLERTYQAEDFTRTVQVPDRPTAAEVKAARELICEELLGDFPFAHPSDKAHAVAMLLEPFVADLVAGPFPLHLIEASVIDSGKTQLGDVCSAIARGRRNAWLNFSGEKEEQAKMLGAALLKLPAIVAVDNVKVTLDLPLLEAALTGSVEIRILGRSELSPPLDTCGTTFMATVNNADLSDDLLRRAVRSRLEPKTERPGDRVFRHPDLIGWVLQHRTDLIAALLTLARNWVVQSWTGATPYTGRTLSSFRGWSEVMGSILAASGIEGFLDDTVIRREMKSEGTSEWHALVAEWQHRFGHRHVSAREILDELVAPPVTRYTKDGASYPVPADAVTFLPDGMGSTKIEGRSKKLGHLLRGRRGQIFNGLKVRYEHDDASNQNLYWLEGIDAPPTQPAAPTSDDGDYSAE